MRNRQEKSRKIGSYDEWKEDLLKRLQFFFFRALIEIRYLLISLIFMLFNSKFGRKKSTIKVKKKLGDKIRYFNVS